jgi:hypothetical protein
LLVVCLCTDFSGRAVSIFFYLTETVVSLQSLVLESEVADPESLNPDSDPDQVFCKKKLNKIFFFVYFFGGLECVGHSFAYVAHL